MFHHIVQVLIYPLLSTLLLAGLVYGSKNMRFYLFGHFMSMFGVGLGAWALGGEMSPDYLRRLGTLALIFFPLTIAVGTFSLWIVDRRASKADYQHSFAMSWWGGSFVTMVLSYNDNWF